MTLQSQRASSQNINEDHETSHDEVREEINHDGHHDQQNVNQEEVQLLQNIQNLPSDPNDIIFENENIKLYIERGVHLRQRRFHLQDHMYYIKVLLKNPNMPPPLLSDLLHLFQEGFNYILTNLSTFYNPEDHNIAFLTLYQEPMINALNTGGFDLQESVSDMIDRILTMLQQFLISNNSLRLNNSFKVYVKVMSIDHMRFKQNRKKKMNPKKKFGNNSRKEEKYPYWLLNVPNGFGTKPNIFKNKCLITATILGHLQNIFYKSNRKDKRFIYAQNINSKFDAKKTQAGKILLNEINALFDNTDILREGPYELEETTKKLSKYFHCQFFIFDAIDNSPKLNYMYPDAYDSSLEPIYLFQPLNQINHVIFIRHLNSYFKANLKICFYCKKTFRSYRYNHFCVKMKGCFACHREFAKQSTFLHDKNKINFCNKNLTTEAPFLCNICNVTLYSVHCQNGHKLLCCGKGSFGWKCLKCNKFTYRYGKFSAKDIKATHVCGMKKCIYCSEDIEPNHLCKLKTEKVPKTWPLMAFIGIEHSQITSENCVNCLTLGERCSNHIANEIIFEPCLIVIYKEIKRGCFDKYVLTSLDFFMNDFIETKILNYEYVSKDLSKHYEPLKMAKKQTKTTSDFNENLKLLQSKSNFELPLLDKFIQLISKPEWQNTTFISQDSNSQNYNTILSGFLKHGFCPKVIQNGRKILFMEVLNLNLRFVTSNSYLEGTEIDLSKQYNFDHEKYYFPESLKLPQYYHYNGVVPNAKHFFNFNDEVNVKTDKENFVVKLQENNYTWNFVKELVRYCDEKLWFLTICCLKFLEESFCFQIMLKTENKIIGTDLLHPFGNNICSLSGFTFKLYKILYLNKENVYIVKNEYGVNTKHVSKLEYEWASFMEFQYPNNQFLSAFNNPNGQFYFKEAIPDLYSPITKEAHFFHGCKWHGHLNSCLIFPNAKGDTKNPVGIDYNTLNEDFLRKATNLLNNNSDKVHKVTIHWECLYLQKRTTTELNHFLQNRFQPHPLRRLCPRACVRGGYSDVYALKWSQKSFPNEKFYFYDVNSLYSYVAITYPFFTSKYQILMGPKLKEISFKNDSCFYNDKQIYGTMLVTILAPPTLYLPCLAMKTPDGKSINTLCSKCLENYSSRCSHSDIERAITDSYFISEIIYALKQNYKLLYIHECHCYETVKYLFKDFIEKLNVLKLQNSNCLSDCSDPYQKKEYCDYLNNEMNLKDPFFLKPSNITNNVAKRTFFKLMANGFFGKFSQKQNKSKTVFASNQQELENIYFSNVAIKEIFCLNDDICQVQIQPDNFKLPPNRKTNCYIGGQITAYARQIMHEHLTSILRIGGTLYQTDTDSICFTLPQQASIPILVSHAIGHFKNEIDGTIISFHSLGSKNYSIIYKNGDKLTAVTKIRGLFLKSHVNENEIDDELFDDYIEKFAKSKKCSKVINQTRFKRLKTNPLQVHPQIEKVTFTNDVSNKRYIDFNSNNFTTFPYGYQVNKE